MSVSAWIATFPYTNELLEFVVAPGIAETIFPPFFIMEFTSAEKSTSRFTSVATVLLKHSTFLLLFN